jgi:hypothetical protein
MTTAVTPAPTKRRRRRRAFSLNGLAIQLSAFALSFTLVALLVVTGSQAAFVEENQIVTNHVPLGLPEEGGGGGGRPWSPSPASPAASSTPPPVLPVVEEPEQPVEPAPVDPHIELTDTDAGSALFTDGTVLAPGTTHSRCIAVSYVGEADSAPVLLYAAGVSGALARYLDLAVEMGAATADAFGSCAAFVPSATVYSGTLAAFAAAHPGYGQGIPTWDPAAGDASRSFRFSVSVRDDPAAEGAATSFGFTWEVRAEG